MKYLIGESIMDNEYEIYLAAQKAHIAFVTGKKDS